MIVIATRRERVILDLQDDFSAKMIKAAGAAALLNRELESLSGQSVKVDKSSQAFVKDVQKMGKEADGAGAKIDRLSGRIGMVADAILLLGPAAIPIGALAVPAVMLLTSSLAALAVGAGTTAIAFGGVGDAIEAANKAHLEPTVENLAAAEELFSKLAPAVEEFSKQFNSMRGLGAEIRNAGAQALFPGLTEALETLESRGPAAIRIMTVFNETVGDIAADAAASLASDRWTDFFNLIEREGPDTLDKTADALGNLAHGVSEVLEAFAPSTADGMDWLVDLTEDFDKWATGLKKTEGFKDFVDYIRETGPQVAETLGALSRALLDILEAAAPLGGPVLQGIEAFAEAVSAIADSGFSTELLAGLTAMRLINRLAPATAGSMALLSGGAGAGAAGAAGGKRGKPGKPGRAPSRGGPALAFAALIGADIITAELEWEEATDRQLAKAEEFTQKWGKTLAVQAESARVGLSKLLDVTTGKGPFGLKANDSGLSEAFLNAPLERQLELRKQLRAEYGVGLKQLEQHGILQKGTTRQFEHQREAVHAFTNDFKRMSDVKATPKIDVDDRGAKRKQREAQDWINKWGGQESSAVLDMLDVSRRKKSKEADDWILNWGAKNESATADVDARPAFDILSQVAAGMNALDGKTATTYIHTVRTGGGEVDYLSGGHPRKRVASGGPIFGAGTATSDSIPAMLSNGEYVIKAAAVDHYGVGTFDRLNAMHFADGGKVDGKKRRRPDGDIDGGETRAEARERREEARERREEQAADAREQEADQVRQMFADVVAGEEKATREWIDAAEVQKSSWESIADGIASQMAAIGSAATSPFQSDLFGDSGNIWGSGQAGWRGALQGDIAGLQDREALIAQLTAAGVSTAGMEALMQQASNQDISALIASGDLAEFDAMIAQRAALTATVSAAAGQAAYGAEFAAANAEVAKYTAELAVLNTTMAAIVAQISPVSESAQQGYQKQGEIIADKVGHAIVNGGNTVARRGNR